MLERCGLKLRPAWRGSGCGGTRKGGTGKANQAKERWAKGMWTTIPQTPIGQSLLLISFTQELANKGVSAFGDQVFLQIL